MSFKLPSFLVFTLVSSLWVMYQKNSMHSQHAWFFCRLFQSSCHFFFTIYDIQYKQNEQRPILQDLHVTLFTQNFNTSVILLLYEKTVLTFSLSLN